MITISLVTATYNCEETIEDCIRSVDSQKNCNIEHIIVDGCSSDSTLDKIKAVARHGRSIESEPDKGIYDALNKGIRRSTGDVVGFLHSDDVFNSEDVLERVSEIFLKNPNVAAVYGDLVYVNKCDLSRVVRSWKSNSFSSDLLGKGWMPPHPTLYVRRELYNSIGSFNAGMKISADYDFMLKLFGIKGMESVYLPFTMVRMRLGGVSNNSLNHIRLKMREDYKSLRKHFHGLKSCQILILKNVSKIHQFF